MNDLQRTPEWHDARLGKLGGSRIATATAKTKSGPSAGRKNTITDLALERTTGVPTNSDWKSGPMQDGIDREHPAIITYEIERNVNVELVGWMDHPRIPMAGCSSDGLVGHNGSVSIKAPLPATHMAMLKGGSIDGGYIKQIQWELGVTGREWCDFVSYCPNFKLHAQTKIVRVRRDDKMIAELEKEAIAILAEVDAETELLRRIEDGEEVNVTLEQFKASVVALDAQ
jgi:hypothetical protein